MKLPRLSKLFLKPANFKPSKSNIVALRLAHASKLRLMSNESVSNKEKGSKESLYSDVFVFHPTARPFHRKNLSELKQNISIIHVGIAHVKINCLLEEMRGETLAKVFWTREEVFPTFSELLFQFIGELKT
jgi:hypothetical protein